MTTETELRRQLRERDQKIRKLEQEMRNLVEELNRQARVSYYTAMRAAACRGLGL